MNNSILQSYGWSSFYEKGLSAKSGLKPGRILTAHRREFLLVSESGLINAAISGVLFHKAIKVMDRPVVGDWVLFSEKIGHSPRIEKILPRKSLLKRTASGARKRKNTAVNNEQLIAANLDYLLIISGLDRDFNPRRVERYLAAAHQGDIEPLIILNKADLAANPEEMKIIIEKSAMNIPVLLMSAKTGMGISELEKLLEPAKTYALLGSSGVGKSTIINAIIGEKMLETKEISHSAKKGVHTTTKRELILIKNGAILMDNPGIRELQLSAELADIDETFADILEISANCRFSDCRHYQEPGCSVRDAIGRGEISETRLQAWHRLIEEKEAQKP
ncbi:MAG TPA: ribosome small subunit-dependent GTPase A [Candidatus Marinimicrobia bacterium]|nr:ribosome small subunit-dependent GTPase A [Candidatus Neomarinimicrobiota bacterium]